MLRVASRNAAIADETGASLSVVGKRRACRTLRITNTTTQQHRYASYAQHPVKRNKNGQLLSRVSGPTDEPLAKVTLGQFWQDKVDKHGDRNALIVRHEPSSQHKHISSSKRQDCIRWTFAQMDQHVRQLVRGMRALGVKRGDRVAVLMMNNSAMASLQIATALIGAILVTLNPSYTSTQLVGALNHVTASCLFIVPSLRSSNYLQNLCTILPSLKSQTKGTNNGQGSVINDQACPSLKRIVLLDNLTNRPGKQWTSESILGMQSGYTFADALDKLNGHAIDYRELLIEHDSDMYNAKEDTALGIRDIINLQLTSGTTGAPKAVGLSSFNLVNNGMMLGGVMHLTHKDILANVPPLFHCFGLTLGNLAAWSTGACVLYPSEGFNAVRTLRAASQERATAIHGVPAHFIAELDVLRKVKRRAAALSEHDGKQEDDQEEFLQRLGSEPDEDWQFALRTGFTSGSTVPIELMRAIMDPSLLGVKEQTVVYGMTETSPVSFACDTRAPVEQRCKTVGRVVPHVHAKICSPDDENGTPLPVGQIGELCTAGYIVMDGGYWQDRARTDEVLQRHKNKEESEDDEAIVWMRTGDLALLNEEGYAEIRGRVKDLIIRGGENLTATGIENCIDTMPGILSSAVVAVPDEKLGETVGVFISRTKENDDEESLSKERSEIRSHVKAHLSGQCAPDWIWFLGQKGKGDEIVPKQMPTTASGKVQKIVLRQWARDLANKGIGKVRRR